MDEELEEIRRKKFEQYKEKYIKGEKSMNKDMPNVPIKVTDVDIDDLIRKYNFIAIDCWAPWCGPCRMFTTIINELAREMQGKIVFGKLNVDENPQTSSKYSIMSIPTLLIFKNGKLIDRIVGVYPKEELKKKLEMY